MKTVSNRFAKGFTVEEGFEYYNIDPNLDHIERLKLLEKAYKEDFINYHDGIKHPAIKYVPIFYRRYKNEN